MSIENRLRAAAAGDLQGVTLWRTAHGNWQANATKDKVAYSSRTDEDPAVALNDVLARWHDGETVTDPMAQAALQRRRLTHKINGILLTCG